MSKLDDYNKLLKIRTELYVRNKKWTISDSYMKFLSDEDLSIEERILHYENTYFNEKLYESLEIENLRTQIYELETEELEQTNRTLSEKLGL